MLAGKKPVSAKPSWFGGVRAEMGGMLGREAYRDTGADEAAVALDDAHEGHD